MTKLRKFARGQDCAVRIPGVCNHNPETTVLAHLQCVDKGMGYKSPDWWGVHACSSCHDVLDGRCKTDMTPKALLLWVGYALYETQKRLIAAGLMKV